MHLQSLELFGFKSFADKTIFNFHEGVTAIVGPNGCGKSNVLDAVRWVLGEQSAKSLRGGEMADVIFNRADTRKPLGFAEVSLTFTNCGEELGVDWHDVRVTRRLFRDGNSEYLLNKTVCRLKDIQSLFADTGVARSAYSMMEQGRIDLILSSRPEDRRAVFEEAAGITKYKTQKREALRKLEATEANLLRISDIIKEVKRQIGSLQRQAGKARKHQALLADLRVLDTHHSREQLDQLEAELESCGAEIVRHQEAERATLEKIESNENELAEQRRELDEIDQRIAEGRAEVQRLEGEIGAHRSRIEFNRQHSQEFAELIERYNSDIAAAETKRAEQEVQIHEANTLVAETNRLLEGKEAELAELIKKSAELRAERSRQEEQLRALELSISKLESRSSALQDELSGSVTRRETTAKRIAELDAALSAARDRRDQLATEMAAARNAASRAQRTNEELANQTRDAEQQLKDYEQAVADAEKNAATVEREIAEKSSRVEILRQLNEEGEGLGQGSQAVLRGLDDPERIRPELGGALLANLEVEQEFIPAIEAALGRNIHAIVLRNAEFAAEIMAKLSQKKLGQAGLAIPELIQAPTTTHASDVPENALAWAIDKVTAPDTVRPLVRRLLHDVIIVRHLEIALSLRKKAPQFQIATLNGEFISSEGIVFGGKTNMQDDSLLGRRARIEILAGELTALEEKQRIVAEKRAETIAQLESAKNRLEEARERHQTAHLTHSTATGQILLLERELEEAERKLENLQNEKATLAQQVSSADERINQLQEELETQQRNLAEQQQELVALEKAKENALASEEESAERLNELRLAVATERQRHENLLSQRQPMVAREAELAELIAARRADIAKYQARLDLQEKESRAAEAAIETQTTERTWAEAQLAAIVDQRPSRVAAVAALETELRGIRNSLNELRNLRGKEEVRETQLQIRIENLVERVSRQYQIDLRAFERDHYAFNKTLQVQLKRRSERWIATSGRDDKNGGEAAPVSASRPEVAIHPPPDSAATRENVDQSDVEKLISELTRQLDNMGPVNLDAVQEYDELEERYRFLESQNNDLTASRRELLDVITRINSTTQKLFAETFAQVRVNFREMFAEMFGGGRADLSLVDENDPLNCGIEISAKPPGKQLQSISLLSGGERTMTAVALLFAIYMVRPSPFCILDEMDAPLDESNINRFIRVLERFVTQSQFIIITHNKHTIAKADILYGVTMEERGVSKLVGMKLADPRATESVSKRGSVPAKPTQHQFALEGTERPRSLAAQ